MQELQPQLAELLRTCVHPSSLILQIVHIEFLDVKSQEDTPPESVNGGPIALSDGTHRYAVKYVLSDGEIMMQALLHRKLTGLRDVAEVAIGDLLEIRGFAVKKSPRSDGQGRIVYLAVEDCHFLRQVRPNKRAASQAEELLETGNVRKRKRTNSHSEPTGIKHVDMVEKRSDIVEPARVEQPSLHRALNQSNAGVVPPVNGNQSEPHNLPQSTHAGTGDIPSRYEPLLPPSGRINMKHKEEMEKRSLFEEETGRKSNQHTLKNTFGARQIIVEEEDDDFFQSLPTDQNTIKQRRRVLHQLDGNTSFNTPSFSFSDNPDQHVDSVTPSKPPKVQLHPSKKSPATEAPSCAPPAPVALTRDSVRDGAFALSQAQTFHLPHPPTIATTKPPPPSRQAQTQPIPQPVVRPALLPSPPFHTLSSLRNPSESQKVPTKSYTLTTLAIISWTGSTTIHRPGSLFPPKRHLKIVDPSLATSRPPSRQVQARQPVREPPSSFKAQNSFQDAVTVAVYIDAANFKPAPGTVVLFRGLVMQRLVNGDIILNAYGRLKEQRFEEPGDENGEGKRDVTEQEENAGDQEKEPGQYDNHWFITDQAKIRKLGHGSRLDYYLDWWAEKQRVQQQPVQN